jgi:hypothetical protein
MNFVSFNLSFQNALLNTIQYWKSYAQSNNYPPTKAFKLQIEY